MEKDRLKASALVAVQMICIVLILVTGPLFAENVILLVMEIAGILLGLWALLVMGWPNFNITPLIKQGAHLVTNGPYARIRHPMYASVLLTMWSLIIDHVSLLRFATGVVLAVDLLIKLMYEERLLEKHFPGYGEYREKTKRLIPFVF
jgi:protein-S-isoprenylcysteine O-methyltransferase Ste14